MATYTNLLTGEDIVRGRAKPATDKKSAPKRVGKRGCDNCPASKNWENGLRPLKGWVKGRKIMLWFNAPVMGENNRKKSISGKFGEWFWSRLEDVGISKEDCDVQYTVRCVPCDWEDTIEELVERKVNKQEQHCCSIYNEEALQKADAAIHVIFGETAAQNLLKSEFKKSKHIIWSEKLNARVIWFKFTPAETKYSDRKAWEFTKGLEYVAEFAALSKGKLGWKWAFLEAQDYRSIRTVAAAKAAAEEILDAALKKKERISVDIEDDVIDGKNKMLVVGFSHKIGSSRVFWLDHPKKPIDKATKKQITSIVLHLLLHRKVKRIMQNGSYDVDKVYKLLGAKISYDYDTRYAEYLAYPGRTSYALNATADVRYPAFAGYKEIISPEAVPQVQISKNKSGPMAYDQAAKSGQIHLQHLPAIKMRLYNGADNDIQKRIEVSTAKKISLPLLHVYMDAAVVLDRMEAYGPLFDYKQHALVEKIFPVRLAATKVRLQEIAGKQKNKKGDKVPFNPNASKQVYEVLYTKLKAKYPYSLGENEKKNTRKDTLELISMRGKAGSEFANLMNVYRRDSKIVGTYIAGFKRSADMNGGRVRTIWKLTGTRTGRMSSGGGQDGIEGVVNLQNVHSNFMLQNMLVSDLNWYDLYAHWKKHRKDKSIDWDEFLDYYIFLAFDYSQVEIRVLAQIAQDPLLIKQFNSGLDIHCLVGHELTGWPIEKIASDHDTRKLIKNMHFGLAYGLSPKSLYDYLIARKVKNITPERAEELWHAYFAKYKGVRRFIDRQREFAEEHGYVETLFGFRRPLDVNGGDDEESEDAAYWGNQAVNSPIQGSAHQLMLMAIASLKRKAKTYNLLSKSAQIEVHDSLFFRIKVRDLWPAFLQGKQLLEQEVIKVVNNDFGINWEVPLVADMKLGFRIGVMNEYKKPTEKDLAADNVLSTWCKANQEKQIIMKKEIAEAEAYAKKLAA